MHVQDDEMHVQNDGLHVQNDLLHVQDGRMHVQLGELHVQDDGLQTKNGLFLAIFALFEPKTGKRRLWEVIGHARPTALAACLNSLSQHPFHPRFCLTRIFQFIRQLFLADFVQQFSHRRPRFHSQRNQIFARQQRRFDFRLSL